VQLFLLLAHTRFWSFAPLLHLLPKCVPTSANLPNFTITGRSYAEALDAAREAYAESDYAGYVTQQLLLAGFVTTNDVGFNEALDLYSMADYEAAEATAADRVSDAAAESDQRI